MMASVRHPTEPFAILEPQLIVPCYVKFVDRRIKKTVVQDTDI